MLIPTEVNDGGWHSSLSGVSAVIITSFNGAAGSLLAIVIVALLAPGSQARTGSDCLTTSRGHLDRKDQDLGTWNSGELEVMLLIEKRRRSAVGGDHVEVAGRPDADPPEAARIDHRNVTIAGAPPVPRTATGARALSGSSLAIVSVAVLGRSSWAGTVSGSSSTSPAR